MRPLFIVHRRLRRYPALPITLHLISPSWRDKGGRRASLINPCRPLALVRLRRIPCAFRFQAALSNSPCRLKQSSLVSARTLQCSAALKGESGANWKTGEIKKRPLPAPQPTNQPKENHVSQAIPNHQVLPFCAAEHWRLLTDELRIA